MFVLRWWKLLLRTLEFITIKDWSRFIYGVFIISTIFPHCKMINIKVICWVHIPEQHSCYRSKAFGFLVMMRCHWRPSIVILTWLGGKPWSWRRFPQGEALPLHFGWADPCECPKCGHLDSAISVSGRLAFALPPDIHPISVQLASSFRL